MKLTVMLPAEIKKICSSSIAYIKMLDLCLR